MADGAPRMTGGFTPGPDTTRALRAALGRFATGVTVVTTRCPMGPLAITANSFSSLSLDPALVLWAPARRSKRFAAFTEAAHFAIHVMAEDQFQTARTFAHDGFAFDGLAWQEGPDATPLLDMCLARFLCARHAVHAGGDHAIVVGRVLEVAFRDGDPLIFSGGRYGGFTPDPDPDHGSMA